jgi:triacylglycerol lipase
LGRANVDGDKQRLAAEAAQKVYEESERQLDELDRSDSASSSKPDSTSPGREKSSVLTASLSAFPSSVTTLLFSLFDEPAYANLTTIYLNKVFNPSTPDDPRVRYFSVGGRTPHMNVWHPLWLPKFVVDNVEESDRARLRSQAVNNGNASDNEKNNLHPWEDDALWGNDGLVTVQSARWGEYLGTLEGCDHWRLRGASGLELGEQLPSIVSREWSRFARVLGRAEQKREEHEEQARELAKRASINRNGEEEEDRRYAEAFKSSTERLSTVVDWLVDQVPTDRIPSLPFIAGARATELQEQQQQRREEAAEAKLTTKEESEAREKRKSQLETDEDLERFYISLARKLYDEGL